MTSGIGLLSVAHRLRQHGEPTGDGNPTSLSLVRITRQSTSLIRRRYVMRMNAKTTEIPPTTKKFLKIPVPKRTVLLI